MQQSHKFLFENAFDTDFGREVEEEEEIVEVPPEPTFSEADVAAARAQGFVEGRSEGIAEMEAAIDQRVNGLLEAMLDRIEKLDAVQAASMRGIERQMLALSAAIARKFVPAIAQEHAERKIEALIRDCLPKLMDEPRIVLRVHPAALEGLRQRIDELAAKSGFRGDIILIADDEIGEADCRVEWADGGAERSEEKIWAGIEEALATHLAALLPRPANARPDTGETNGGPRLEPDRQELNEEKANG